MKEEVSGLFSSPPWTPQPGAAAGARTQTAEAGPREREPLSLYPPQPPALRQAHFSDKVPSPSKVIFRCLRMKANTPFQQHFSGSRWGYPTGWLCSLPPPPRHPTAAGAPARSAAFPIPHVPPSPQEGGGVSVEVGRASTPGVSGHSVFSYLFSLLLTGALTKAPASSLLSRLTIF